MAAISSDTPAWTRLRRCPPYTPSGWPKKTPLPLGEGWGEGKPQPRSVENRASVFH